MEEKDIANPETAGTPETETPVMDNNTADETPKIQELQQQLDEARNKYLYLFSDFDNYRRNAARERMDLIQTRLIHQKLVSTLQTKGLKVLEINVGDDFNADFQEAVAEIPAASEAQKGKIIDILEQGYQLGERIIRFAKVVVGR
jgi:molecular chaperone GrpE